MPDFKVKDLAFNVQNNVFMIECGQGSLVDTCGAGTAPHVELSLNRDNVKLLKDALTKALDDLNHTMP